MAVALHESLGREPASGGVRTSDGWGPLERVIGLTKDVVGSSEDIQARW